MRIAIYTRENMSIVSRLNISELISQKPGHEYKFFYIKEKRNYNILNKTKTVLYNLINEPNQLKKDIIKIFENIKPNIKIHSFDEFQHEYVDALNDFSSQQALRLFNPDIVIQADAGLIEKNIITIPNIGILNIHHGLSPEIRGINSTFWCLYFGLLDYIGSTCHFIDKNIDTGPVIKQYIYKFCQGDTYEKIQTDLYVNGARLLSDAINILDRPYDIKSEVVKSCYFGSVDYKLYNKLKLNNYLPLSNIDNLKFKLKEKQTLYSK